MRRVLAIGLAATLLALATPASAEQSVVVNGTTYTCTNQCVVTATPTGYSVADCCGGRMKMSFPPPQAEP